MTDYSGPFEFFADMFIKGQVYWGSWAEHVLGWWRHRDDENVLFLKYEDMKKMGSNAVCGRKRMFDLLGFPPHD